MQYTFPGGDLRADAVIKYDDHLIPIDAKFSLDNYNRYVEATTDTERETFAKAIREDFKKRIDETAKYVRPQDNTFEFAMMFVPSEALYYDLIVNQVGALGRERSLIDYAHEKHVVLVSPMVLYAYLQTVLQGIRQMRFAQDAQEIRKRVGELASHLRSYEEYLRKMGIGIKNAASAYNGAVAEFNKIDKDVVRISGESAKALVTEDTGETL
jgi:DNA recombination protein RmuC